MVDDKVINIVKDYLRKLEIKGLHISKAYLYGSQAKGNATKDSDIDLMLVSPLFDDNTDSYAALIWFSASEVSYKIEPITVGEKKFQSDEYSPLIGIVKKEGIEIAA
ncbi:MAG: nucleotidyltransferase domain-containing protein [Ignavibacteriaceae bacterium]|nr:nucleotidyltransferase domain-containing protein [Ignavibacteriaceae bacterium]